MLKYKIISSLDKALPSGTFDDYKEQSHLSVLRGETASFQLLYTIEGENQYPYSIDIKLSGELADYTRLREVSPVPAVSIIREKVDDDYITTSPTLIPDVLAPMGYNGRFIAVPGALRTLWIDVSVPEDARLSGKKELTVSLSFAKTKELLEEYIGDASVTVDILNCKLPESTLLFTQWFHHDCLANYYGVEMWSDRHFEIIDKFVECAVKNGINTLLTPIITPPLDNAYDTRSFQLADVELVGGEYVFSFDKLARWIDICNRHGVKYFEIGHLFTQGGAKRATKVVGWVNGELVRLFPVDTPCDDPEYVRFLRALISSLIEYMKARGDDGRMMFHISDEPPLEDLETYSKARGAIWDLISDYRVFDALSDYKFYETGIVRTPVVLLEKLDNFIGRGVEDLWTYNCCIPKAGYSNRFLAMTLSRNRSISLLLYKFNIKGFLHWGYNFYNNLGSASHINPFLDTSAGGGFPAGDAFSVYPGEDGEPLESMRLVSFRQGLDDLRAFRLCEKLYSRDEVISVLESELGHEIKTNTYVNDSDKMTALRERINQMIKAKL